MYLLDTNVVSAARKREPSVLGWIERHDAFGLAISVVTLGEVERGVHMKRRRDPAAARHLQVWLNRLHNQFRDRTFDIDDRVALEWGRIDALRTRGVPDGLIAATALVHDLTLVTRNVADFADTGVRLLNPWQA